MFIPNLGEDDPIWRAYFSKGLVQPPTREDHGFNKFNKWKPFFGKVIKLNANEWQFWRDFHLRVTLPIRRRIPQCYMANITLDTAKSKGGLKVMFLLSLWWFLGSFALGFSYHFPFLEHIPSKGTFHLIDVLWDDHPTHHEDVSGKMKYKQMCFWCTHTAYVRETSQNSFTSSSTLELNINHFDGIYPMLVVVASYPYHSKKHINCGIPVIILVYQRIRSLKRTAVRPWK